MNGPQRQVQRAPWQFVPIGTSMFAGQGAGEAG